MPMPSKRKWPADPYQTTAPGSVSAPSAYQTRTTGTAANDATARGSRAPAGQTLDVANPAKPGRRVPAEYGGEKPELPFEPEYPPGTPGRGDLGPYPVEPLPDAGDPKGPGGGVGSPIPPDPWRQPGTIGGGTGGVSELGANYESPTEGLYGYYQGRVGSTGMADDVNGAYFQDTALPVEAQAKQAQEAMLRARAATGNDAGLSAGIAESQKTATEAQGDMTRKNLLTQAQIAREDQREGSAGLANLYGQQQAQTMEYLRMLGNLLGRQRGVTTEGSSTGFSGGINWNPGGATGGL